MTHLALVDREAAPELMRAWSPAVRERVGRVYALPLPAEVLRAIVERQRLTVRCLFCPWWRVERVTIVEARRRWRLHAAGVRHRTRVEAARGGRV